jgi:hypothetical protein
LPTGANRDLIANVGVKITNRIAPDGKCRKFILCRRKNLMKVNYRRGGLFMLPGVTELFLQLYYLRQFRHY